MGRCMAASLLGPKRARRAAWRQKGARMDMQFTQRAASIRGPPVASRAAGPVQSNSVQSSPVVQSLLSLFLLLLLLPTKPTEALQASSTHSTVPHSALHPASTLQQPPACRRRPSCCCCCSRLALMPVKGGRLISAHALANQPHRDQHRS